ncbi:MAG: glycerate kinase [Bacteroidota bacterium]
MNVLVATDKFKGSLTAFEACNAIKEGILQFDPTADIQLLPLADGGEGSLEVIQSKLQFKKIHKPVSDPLFKPVDAWYGLNEKTAYIEMANASGLMLIEKKDQHAPSTTTLGTGELIADALQKGANKIYLFVGGSATNDAGIGMAHALGYRFLNNKKKVLNPVGASLNQIAFIEGKPIAAIRDTEFILVSDVKNPLYGKNGAAKVFAKQKGANELEINQLDSGLKHFNEVIKSKWDIDISHNKGAGAAGGLGAGAMIFLNAKTREGINSIMEIVQFDAALKDADYVISGEGKFDKQTLEGKVVKGVMDACMQYQKPMGVVCGVSELSEKEIKNLSIKAIKAIKNKTISLSDSINNAYELLIERSKTLMAQLLG